MSLRQSLCIAAVCTVLSGECRAIEMWTFYGDGSRIGLPSLEVPVEAYPGIPLRSDRIRARRRGGRPVPAAAPVVPGAMAPGTITLRAAPAVRGHAGVPVAPDPDDVLAPARR